MMHAGASLKRKAGEQLSGPTASIRRMETALKGISQVMGTAVTNKLFTICISCSRAGLVFARLNVAHVHIPGGIFTCHTCI